MGFAGSLFEVVNGALDRAWKVKAWLEPHVWNVTTAALVILIPLAAAGEIDKTRLMTYTGRMRDNLTQQKQDAAGAELESKLIGMNTGALTQEAEEEVF